MRTTLTLDDDVAVLLERMRQEKNLTLKEAVNQAYGLACTRCERNRNNTPSGRGRPRSAAA